MYDLLVPEEYKFLGRNQDEYTADCSSHTQIDHTSQANKVGMQNNQSAIMTNSYGFFAGPTAAPKHNLNPLQEQMENVFDSNGIFAL